MEMPKGWKKLAFDSKINRHQPSNVHEPGDVYYAMTIMKDMAEALHTIDVSCNHGLVNNPGVKLITDKILKRFNQWGEY